MAGKRTKTNLQRFEEKYVVNEETGCWEWTAGKFKTGYGSFGVNYFGARTMYAHRVSYRFYVDYIPDGMFVCHTCDNRSCVNPDHLFLGSHQDNMKDMVTKNRHVKGETCGHSLLTNEVVLSIRDEYTKSGATQTQLAKKHGIDQSAVSLIVNRKRWKHI